MSRRFEWATLPSLVQTRSMELLPSTPRSSRRTEIESQRGSLNRGSQESQATEAMSRRRKRFLSSTSGAATMESTTRLLLGFVLLLHRFATASPLLRHCFATAFACSDVAVPRRLRDEVNMTNGVTPRRWVHCANPALSEIFTEYLGLSTASYIYHTRVSHAAEVTALAILARMT